MKDNVQGCPRCGHNWKFGEINKETCGFHQCGCRHEWHAIPRIMSAVPERGAPPEKPVCLICGLPPDHEWHGVSNHVYVPKLAGHDSAGAAQPKMKDDPVYGAIRVAICDEYIAAGSPTPKENWLYSRLVEARTQFAYEAGAANSPSPEVRQAWEQGRDEVCNMLVYAGAALDRGSPLKDCLASLVESGKAMQYPGPAAPPATKEGK